MAGSIMRLILHPPDAAADHAANTSAAPVGARDPAAFARVFHTHAPALYGFAHAIVRSREEARDIVQGAFGRAWEGGRGWPSEGKLVAYLYRIVRNEALMLLRHARVEHRWRGTQPGREAADGASADARSADPYVAPAPDELVHQAELRVAVRRAVDALPERTRLVVVLSRFTDLPHAEIARVLGITVKGVEWHLHRAFTMLRAQLGAQWPVVVIAVAAVAARSAVGTVA
jgi:RNA polymerase sigma-70 factor (ECF subfamily)